MGAASTVVAICSLTYTMVTLGAMVGAVPPLSDTVCVMPTDKFVYLPLILCRVEGLALRAH